MIRLMNKFLRTTVLVPSMTVGMMLGLPALQAHADIFSSAKKELHKGEKAVEHEAKKDASAVKQEVNKDTSAATKEVNKGTAAVESGFLKGLGKTRSLFSQDEISSIEAKAKRSYESQLKAAEADYKKALAEAQAIYDQAKQALLRSALDRAYKRYDGFLRQLGANFTAAQNDEAMKAALKRLVSAGADRRVDAQVVADMQLVGNRLGLVEESPHSIVPGRAGGAFKSSWGIGIGAHVGAVVGGTALVGIVSDCNAPHQAGPFVLPAATVGYQAGTPGYAELVVFWQPGTVDEVQGLWLGLTGTGTAILAPTPNSGAPSVGLTVTGQYKVFSDKGGHIKWPSLELNEAIPGFWLGVAGTWGATGNVSVEVSHLWTWPVSASAAQQGARGANSGGVP